MTVREASVRWGLTPQTIRVYIRRGLIQAELRSTILGGKYWEVLSPDKPLVARGAPRKTPKRAEGP